MHMSRRIIQIGTKFDISSEYSLLKIHCLHPNCQLTQDLIHIFRGEPLVRSSPSPTSGDKSGVQFAPFNILGELQRPVGLRSHRVVQIERPLLQQRRNL